MHARLWWYVILAACVLLAWARWRAPAAVGATVATVGRASPSSDAVEPAIPAQLPRQLTRARLEAAERDPFAEMAAPPPLPAPSPPLVASKPAAPIAPPLNLTFSGRVTGPDGQLTIFGSQGTETIALSVGQTLPNGYRVKAIKEGAVEFDYPALQTTALLELPPAPQIEIR